MKMLAWIILGVASIAILSKPTLAQNSKVLTIYSGQNLIEAKRSITLKSGVHIPTGSNVVLKISNSSVPPNFNTSLSTAHNYIFTRDFLIPGVTSTNIAQVRKVNEEKQEVKYFDGLGKVIQSIQIKASPNYNDIVQHIEYDKFGREAIKYLPYGANESGTGSFKSNPVADISAYYTTGLSWDYFVVKTEHPYAKTLFEHSSINRPQQNGAEGASWQPSSDVNQDHTVKTDYEINGFQEVKKWTIDFNGNGAYSSFYDPGRLFKKVVRNENVAINVKAGSIEEFRDIDGNIVLIRIWETESKSLSTYYLYDKLGNLLFVLPPSVNENGKTPITNSFVEDNSIYRDLIYSYKYDYRNRMIEKKIPGKGRQYFIYNSQNQVVLTQDANQRKHGQWTYSKYDAFGRTVSTGIYTNTVDTTAGAVRNILDNYNGPLWENRNGNLVYSNNSFPIAHENATVSERTVNYYDDYNFSGASSLPAVGITKSDMTNSLKTGTKIYDTEGLNPLITVTYYDSKAQILQTVAQNHLTGTDYITNSYSFDGKLLTSVRLHKGPVNSTTTRIFSKNEYDHSGRLTSVQQKLNTQNLVTITQNSYNEVGQLIEKELGADSLGLNSHLKIMYTYNERGWLTSTTSPYFSQQLKYQNPTHGAPIQWNGNISEQHWGTTENLNERFIYTYDKLNRLKNGTSSTSSMSEITDYDEMGNITLLNRDGANLNYTYSGNQLVSVSGITKGNYNYDKNGNVHVDRREMNFSYNYLNLPKLVSGGNNSISYTYDSNGVKLRKNSNQTGQRDYLGGLEYQNGILDLVHIEEGVAIRKTDGTFSYRYNLADHLGNVRATIYRNPNNGLIETLQRDDYYPFGMRKVVAGGNNKYLYNGKEIQGELGDQYDYGARFYDPVIGRWNVVDPRAEEDRRWSPYRYGYNNPIRFIDPDGMREDDILYNQSGKEMDRIVNNLPDRHFMQYDNGNYTYQGANYIQVNSKETIVGDPREIEKGTEKPGFDGKLDSYTGKLGPTVARATSKTNMGLGGIALESLEPKNVYGGKGKGNLDFVGEFKADVLYDINGTYYSKHEALNYVWGAAMKKTGQNIGTFLSAADAYHKVHHRTVQNNEPSHNEAIKKGFYNAPGRATQIYTIPAYYNEKKWLSRPIGK